MAINLPPSTPKCALLSKTVKMSQKPYCSTFGVFPDETLTTSFDRLLHVLGVGKQQKSVPSPSQESVNCDCEVSVKVCETENDSGCKKKIIITDCVKCKDPCSKCSEISCHPVICRRCSPVRVKIDTSRGKNVSILKRSFSLCSLACRKVKEKIFRCPKTHTSRWLWTKLQCQNNGCQVYEVYKNSTVTSHPTHFDNCRAARIILIILPSGIIMPFETLPTH